MSTRFVLVSRWRVGVARERVWGLLVRPEDWPAWWPQLVAVRRIAGGHPGGIGDRCEFRWTSGLGYEIAVEMTTTRTARPAELEAAANGDLRGIGLWLLDEEGPDSTRLTYRWDVEIAKPWMRRLAPMLRPVFAWRHFAVMKAAGQGMARHLGGAYAAIDEWSTIAALPDRAVGGAAADTRTTLGDSALGKGGPR